MASEDYSLGADYPAAMQEIGQRFDRVDAQQNVLSQKLDEQEMDLSELKAILRQNTREVRDLRLRVGALGDKIDTLIALLTKQGE